jgi:putative ABC transport system permease protein
MMTLLDLVKKELWHRKTQLISGLLTMTIGIAVIVAIKSISTVSERAVAIKLDNLGANILVLPQGTNIDDYYSADIDAPLFSENYVSKIVSSTLPGIDNMSPKLTRRITIGKEHVVLTGILPKSEIASKPLWQKTGLTGKQLKVSCAPSKISSETAGLKDSKLQRKSIDTLANGYCLMGISAARRLNKKENDPIIIEGKTLLVSKILPETGTVDDDRIFINLRIAQQLLNATNQISSIEIMGCCNEISDGLLTKLKKVLPGTHITTIGQIVATQIETNQMMKKLMFAFMLIIIVVGSFSIGNFTWANVNERKKEIGVLRLIGYSKKDVYFIMMAKALFLGIAGGIAGYLIGTIAAMLISPEVIGMPAEIMPSLLLVSLLLSISISLVGAAIPAYLAGKIEPFANLQDE